MDSRVGGKRSGSGPRLSSNPLLEAITNLVNLLPSGEVPQGSSEHHLFGDSITVITKKGEWGQAYIAVGYTWHRLAGKVATSLMSARAAALLAPRQQGMGITSGPEAAVQACRRYVENMPHGHVFVKIDGFLQWGERFTVWGVLAAQSHEESAAGGPAKTALLLPGLSRYADITAVADFRRLSGRHVNRGRGRQGGGGLHLAGVGCSKAQTHTQPIQV